MHKRSARSRSRKHNVPWAVLLTVGRSSVQVALRANRICAPRRTSQSAKQAGMRLCRSVLRRKATYAHNCGLCVAATVLARLKLVYRLRTVAHTHNNTRAWRWAFALPCSRDCCVNQADVHFAMKLTLVHAASLLLQSSSLSFCFGFLTR